MLLVYWNFDTIKKRVLIFYCWKFEVYRSKGCKVTDLKTLRIIQPRTNSNPGWSRLHTFWLEWPKWQTFFWELQLWQLGTLKPIDLHTSFFKHLKIRFSLVSKRVEISRGLQHYKSEFCPLEVTSFSWGLCSNCL